MLDRASSFAREDVIELLCAAYVPVALDVWYEERRHHAEVERAGRLQHVRVDRDLAALALDYLPSRRQVGNQIWMLSISSQPDALHEGFFVARLRRIR